MDLEQRYVSSKKTSPLLVAANGNESSDTSSEVNLDGNEKIRRTNHKRIDENGSKDVKGTSNYSEEVAGTNESGRYFELDPRFKGEQPEITKNSNSQPSLAKNFGYSSSSSSSVSSLDDIIQVKVANRFTNSSKPPKPGEYVKTTVISDDNDRYSDYSQKSEVIDNGSPCLASKPQLSVITPEPCDGIMTPTTQSPVIQTMDRSGGYESYDPFRIPSSVFASKPTTPMEWSVASNESLFSLHIGNNSFSKDHIISLGDFHKFDELTKSGELFLPSPPPVSAVDEQFSARKSGIETHRIVRKEENVKDATLSNVSDLTEGSQPAPIVSWNSSINSKHSNERGTSKKSLAFPVKKKKCGWRLCYCYNCSWGFCNCRRPRCYIRCASCHCSNCSWASCCRCSNCSWASCCRCSNCSWASCCHWNCCQKRSHNRSMSFLRDGEKIGSAKTDDMKQHQPITASELVPPKSASCCWFPSLSYCYPRCCSCSSYSCSSCSCSSCSCHSCSCNSCSCNSCSCHSCSFRRCCRTCC